MLGEVAAQEAGQAILRYLRTSALKLKQLKDFSQVVIGQEGVLNRGRGEGHFGRIGAAPSTARDSGQQLS